MFETVAPDREWRRRRLFYESLPLSIALHACALALLGLAVLAHLTFPQAPPRVMVSYLLLARAAAVPPPPPPPPLTQRRRVGPVAPSIPMTPIKIVAPDLIPETIPDVEPQSVQPAPVNVAKGSEDTEGEANGDLNGVVGGITGGVTEKKVTGGGLLLPDGRVRFDRQAVLPMMSINYAYPIYPEMLRIQRQEGDVVLRYVIGKNGTVTSVLVLEPSLKKEFDNAALEAIRRWRFRPLIIDGEAREVIHEVLVSFRLQ